VAEITTLPELARLLRQLRRREARLRSGAELTYRELAAKTGWSTAIIGEYLSGGALPPTDRFDTLVQLLGATRGEQGALATARDRVAEARRSGGGASGDGDGPGGAGRGAAAPATPGPAPPGPAVPRQLPAPVSGFTGRADQLARLDRLLTAASPEAGPAPTMVISAVSGMAGIGKTTLALYWAHRIADRFPDGQLYLNLRGFDLDDRVVDPADAVRSFLDALQVPAQRIPDGLDARTALYRSLLAGSRVLIVLDNARDAGQVRPLLPGTPGCLVLVTSRNRLTGLIAADGAHPIMLDVLAPAEARELLALRLGPDRITAEPYAVEEIVTRCGRLPLALAIVAARAATQPDLSLSALATELRDTGDRWTALSGDDPATDVRTVFSWSYRALTPPAARLFRLLGLHPGPDLSAPAAASLAGLPLAEVRRLLAELARTNLVIGRRADRYTFHDLLRAYAAEQVRATDPEPERGAAARRMLDHYLHTAYGAERQMNRDMYPLTLDPPAAGVTPETIADHDQAMAWFTAEHGVLLAMVNHAAATGFDTHTWQLAWSVQYFLDQQGRWTEMLVTGHAGVAATQRLGDPIARARTHCLLAYTYTKLGRFADAHTQLREALEVCQRAGHQTGQAQTHRLLGQLWDQQGHHTEARDHARQSLELLRATGNRRGQAGALNDLGWYHTQLGDHQEALASCQEALALHQEFDHRRGQAETWDSIGYAHHRIGNYAEAVASYRQALGILRDLNERYYLAATLVRLGETHDAAGNRAAARDAWHQAATILDELRHPDADQVRARLAEASEVVR
jgi:tetratricopeptide (TPR) repeat protein